MFQLLLKKKLLNQSLTSVLSNGFWLSFRYAIISFVGFFVSVIFAREYPAESYGEFQLIISTMALFSVFSLPGLNMLGIRSIASSGIDYTQKIVRISFLSSLIAVPLLVVYGLYFLNVKENTYLIRSLFYTFDFQCLIKSFRLTNT